MYIIHDIEALHFFNPTLFTCNNTPPTEFEALLAIRDDHVIQAQALMVYIGRRDLKLQQYIPLL